jgi:hypothetical protein
MLSLLISSTIAAASFCVPESFCIYAEPQNTSVLITVHSSATGWTAFGVGDTMTNSPVTVGWLNSTNGVTISDRFATGRRLPRVATPSSELVELRVGAPVWARTSFTVRKPLVFQEGAFTTATKIMYAQSATRKPANVDDPNSTFAKHTEEGYLGVFDFVTPQ